MARRSMMRPDPTGAMNSLFEEILNPFRPGYGHVPRTWDVGTKESPAVIVRREMVERKYHAWQEDDGSYHEVLIQDDSGKFPTRPEITD